MRNVTFIHLGAFVSDARRLGFIDDDIRSLELLIGENPNFGKLMPGTGGVRKIRFAPPSWHTGKSGGARVAFTFVEINDTVYLIAAYAKNEKENLSHAERNALHVLMERLHRKGQYK